MNWLRRNRKDVVYAVIVVGLLGLVYLLPPDTSLKLVRESGVLRVCVPTSYPPLVTGEADKPGIDLEVLEQVADDLGVRLLPVTNSSMGRDFNPRNWRVTRAQCAILAGGVVATDLTRSFLDTTEPYLLTSWALVTPTRPDDLDGKRVGFHAGISGLDRISLSRFLREQGAEVTIINSSEALAQAIASGEVDAGISESILAQQLAGSNGWNAYLLADELDGARVAYGLWKGDLTLKRAVEASLAEMERNGRMDTILRDYGLVELEDPLF